MPRLGEASGRDGPFFTPPGSHLKMLAGPHEGGNGNRGTPGGDRTANGG